MPPSEKKVLFLGFGAVAQCTLPIFLKHVHVPPKNITVMDFEDQAERHGALDRAGGPLRPQPRHPRQPRRRCWASTLSAGDLLIDLAWNIDCCELLQWCHRARRALRQHLGRGLGPLRRRRAQASHRTDALLAAHEHPPHDGPVERARPHRRARARRQSGPDLPLDQAGAASTSAERLLADKQVAGAAAEEIRALDRHRQLQPPGHEAWA